MWQMDEAMTAQAQRLVAKAWADTAFKQALLTNPMATLAAEGVVVPPGLQIKVFENTPGMMHVILPQPPSEMLSDEAVASAAGGSTCGCDLGAVTSCC
jgi:hypothetical protein